MLERGEGGGMCPWPVLLSPATFVDKVRQVSFTAGSGDEDRKKKGDKKKQQSDL